MHHVGKHLKMVRINDANCSVFAFDGLDAANHRTPYVSGLCLKFQEVSSESQSDLDAETH